MKTEDHKNVTSERYPERVQGTVSSVCQPHLTSKALAQWSDEQYWYLMEGSGKDDKTRSAKFLREVLYDVAAQWECLVAEFHSTKIEFPEELITDWFSQVTQFIESDEEAGESLLLK
ncbi:hypothetical protein NIES2119_08445 [[Phormidium ambiguum] IAM M-71]|uniref:Uncharacterized protein n=1 Tax=[Phormidium ambiguum] IAM M-71 TaxID=454136 RepID=A0A1U7IN00_9CYAN|nr:hypothetical protein [Phormidium ambiguum]OKH38619.1 hypothetical protein NIES2119_08445 [Phormidium ambiguum IAM M-71]